MREPRALLCRDQRPTRRASHGRKRNLGIDIQIRRATARRPDRDAHVVVLGVRACEWAGESYGAAGLLMLC